MYQPYINKISIIILSWNTKELLRRCLESIYDGYKMDINRYKIEIIVVDNGSKDGSREFLRKLKAPARRAGRRRSKFKVIFNKENLGFARGNNQALRQAQGELVMLLNSDTVVKKGALDKLVKFLDGYPEVGAVSPLLLNEDGSIQKDPCYLKFPSPLLTFFYYNKILKQLAINFFPKMIFSTTDFSQPIAVDQLPGAALIIRKDILDKIGGFDEDYQLYFEDTDLCWRIKELGYKLMVVPRAKIVHLGRRSIEPVIRKKGIERFYFLNFSSLFLFCEKNYPRWKTGLIKIIVLSHLLLSFKLGLIAKLLKER